MILLYTSSLPENNVIAFLYGPSSIFKAFGEVGGCNWVLPARMAIIRMKTGIDT